VTGCVAADAWGRRKYAATIGSRGALARRLDQLAVGTTSEFNAALFGAPQYRSAESGMTKLTFDCGHALVAIILDGADSVAAFGLTVIDPNFGYGIDRLILCGNGAKLGRSHFAELGKPLGGAEFRVGKRDAWYLEDHTTTEADGTSMNYTVAMAPFGSRGSSLPPTSESPRDYMISSWSTRSTSSEKDHAAEAIPWAKRSFVMNTLLFPSGAEIEPIPEAGTRRQW